MPWTAKDAAGHTKKATSPHLQRLWANVANSELKSSGDDAIAVRAANSAVRHAVGNSTSNPKPRKKKA